MKVIIDCYNQKLGEITFPNRPADFFKLVTKVKKCNTDGKEVVYGLENAYGYGRVLAVWLIDKGYLVKDVNTAISHRQAKHRGAMYRKSDSDDAKAIALTTIPGVNVITAVKILAEIGDIKRFGNANKLAQFAGIAPLHLSSSPVVRAYYEKRKDEGKTSQQALICISRRLISIIYGMLKNGTEYRMPAVENAGENR